MDQARPACRGSNAVSAKGGRIRAALHVTQQHFGNSFPINIRKLQEFLRTIICSFVQDDKRRGGDGLQVVGQSTNVSCLNSIWREVLTLASILSMQSMK